MTLLSKNLDVCGDGSGLRPPGRKGLISCLSTRHKIHLFDCLFTSITHGLKKIHSEANSRDNDHTHAHTRTRTRTHARTHARTHTHAHAHAHTHTRTRTYGAVGLCNRHRLLGATESEIRRSLPEFLNLRLPSAPYMTQAR